MPGFNKTRFVEVSEEDLDEYCCGICFEVFNKPLVTPCCRQTYCSDCINQWLTQHNTCPNDRKRLTVNQLSSPPRFAINLFNKLKIKCDFHTNGCKMIVALNQLSIHSVKCASNPRNRRKICEFCAIVIQSDHNCIKNLKIKNEIISEEMKRLRHQIKELKVENEEIVRVVRNENSVLKEENQRLLYSTKLTGNVWTGLRAYQYTKMPDKCSGAFCLAAICRHLECYSSICRLFCPKDL